jgi:hypothetical protein
MGMIRRRKHSQQAGRINDEAVAAWKARDRRALHQALRLPPHQVSPLDAYGECPYPLHVAGGMTWATSSGLRSALQASWGSGANPCVQQGRGSFPSSPNAIDSPDNSCV